MSGLGWQPQPRSDCEGILGGPGDFFGSMGDACCDLLLVGFRGIRSGSLMTKFTHSTVSLSLEKAWLDLPCTRGLRVPKYFSLVTCN